MTQYVDGIAEIPQSRCIVSDDYRTITIPAKERTLGCVGDDETRRVWWEVPLENDGISLRGFALSIHYMNAAGHANRYDVAEAYVVDNRVLFAWLVQRGAYEAAGLVSVSIKMRALDGTNVLDEFNSTTAPFTVKPAHNYDAQPQPEQEDYIGAFIEQQEARVTAKLTLVDEAIADAQEATAEATTAAQTANASASAADEATAQANSAAGNANQAATDIREAAERGDFDGEKGEKGDPGEKGETGATGAPGEDGADGYSPTVTTEQTATGATITITDKDGAHTATIANGERGPQGEKGDPGELLEGSVTYDKLYQPLAEAITLKGSDSGETVTTDDAAELPLYSLTVHGKSVQDGTPTPDNPVTVETVSGTPVVMCNGRNILKPALYNTNIYSLDNDVFYNSSALSWGWSYNNSAVAFTLEPSTYTVSGFAVNGRWNSASALMRLYSADGTVIVSAPLNGKTEVNETFTIEVQTTIGIAVKNYPNTIGIKFQLEYGSTATPYEPYQESSATIDLQGHELAEGDALTIDRNGNAVINGETVLPSIVMPTPIDGGTIRVVANVTPTIDATWIKDATKAHGDIATTDASIAAVESTVATSNHAIGSYFVVDNQLYKATRAIATGEAITPGTNCTETTVMAELVALTS